jgi:negative regulator of sigma E activity
MKIIHDENLSSFLDNEITANETNEFLQAFENDTKLQHKLDRYALIRGALKADVQEDVDILAKVQDAMRYEPTVLAPKHKMKRKTPYIVTAVAASFFALSVVLINPEQVGYNPNTVSSMASVEQDASIELALEDETQGDELESIYDEVDAHLDTRLVTFEDE